MTIEFKNVFLNLGIEKIGLLILKISKQFYSLQCHFMKIKIRNYFILF